MWERGVRGRKWSGLVGMALVAATGVVAGGQDADDSKAEPRTIRKSVVVSAPVADVWAAWTTREGITSFFGADAKVELKVGGAYEVYFAPSAPEGSRGSEGCHVLGFVPQELLAFSWSAPPSIPTIRKERTQVVLFFERIDARQTRVRLVHHGWGTGEDWDQAFAYFDRAWGAVLQALQARFAEGETTKETAMSARQQFIYFIEPTRPTFTQDATKAEDAKVAEHFAYLQRLHAAGSLVLAGRTLQPQPVGIVVFEAENEEAAQAVFAEDPAVKAGVFKGRVAPYKVALLRGQ